MPDENGELTDEDKKKLNQWMEHKNIRCPVCEGTNWSVTPQLVAPVPVDKALEAGHEGKTQAALLATCTSCASILSLNANTVGII